MYYRVHFFDKAFKARWLTAIYESEIDMIYEKIRSNGFYYLGCEKIKGGF